MKSTNTIHHTYPLTEQPTSWPSFFLLPKTRYVRRQRAANSPYHQITKTPSSIQYGKQGKRPGLRQRIKNRLTDTRRKIWISVKLAGRRLVRQVVRWFVLPLAVITALSIVTAQPAELPDSDIIDVNSNSIEN